MDLCKALQVEYTEKPGNAPSRGKNSAAAKAAEGVSDRLGKRADKLVGVSTKSTINGLDMDTKEIRQAAFTV